MRVFTYSEARQHLAKLLTLAQTEEVRIKRKDGSVFILRAEKESILRAEKESPKSPFDVLGIKTQATTQDILEAVRESRVR
jgi:predicted regulator of Ras-like GTPase activity (Roadblock/LC7/MglB family)